MASDQDTIMGRAPDLEGSYREVKRFFGMIRNPLGSDNFPAPTREDIRDALVSVYDFLMRAEHYLANGKFAKDGELQQTVGGIAQQCRDAMLVYQTRFLTQVRNSQK
jgi:hypothetical protein